MDGGGIKKPQDAASVPERTMHVKVVEAIGRMVFTLQPGRALPTEQELMSTLQVSRSTLREAVKGLVGKGLLEVRPRTGTRVRPRHLWNNLDPDVLLWAAEFDRERTIVELNELRSAVEPAAASLAALHAGPGEVAALWRHFLMMEDALTAHDLGAFVEADALFHVELFGAGGNAMFRSLGHTINALLSTSFGSIASEIEDVSASIGLHRAVVIAVSSHAPAEAASAMTAVVDATVRRIGLSRDTDTT